MLRLYENFAGESLLFNSDGEKEEEFFEEGEGRDRNDYDLTFVELPLIISARTKIQAEREGFLATTNEFVVGSLVELMSGGPPMTIETFIGENETRKAWCIWMLKGIPHGKPFKTAMLKLLD